MRAPPRRYRCTLITTLVVAIATLVACVAAVPNGSSGANDLPQLQAQASLAGVVSVDNTQFPDVDVYVLRDGTTVRRLGQVTGFSTKAFALRSSDVVMGAAVSFGAHSIGSRDRFTYQSTSATAQPGALYEWKLGGAGPGTDFLSQRQSTEYSSTDADPPNRRDPHADAALRLRFGATSVARANMPATFVLARLE